MFYKKSNENWYLGVVVILPIEPETRLTESNRENDFGWIWHEHPPLEYIAWKEEQVLKQAQVSTLIK